MKAAAVPGVPRVTDAIRSVPQQGSPLCPRVVVGTDVYLSAVLREFQAADSPFWMVLVYPVEDTFFSL